MKWLISCVNSTEYKRIRIGIDRPNNDQIEHVLGNFSKNDKNIINQILEKAPNIIDDLVINGIDYIMNHYNQ